MIELITPSGNLDLGTTSIPIEITNSLFIDGLLSEYSLPFTLPNTARNLAIFNWPNMPAAELPTEPITCQLIAEGLNLNGTVSFDSYNEEGIKVTFASASAALKQTINTTFLNGLNFGTTQIANQQELFVLEFDFSVDISIIPNDWNIAIGYRQPGTGATEITQSFAKKATWELTLDNLVYRFNNALRPQGYSSATTYAMGDIVQQTGLWYGSMVAGNVGNDVSDNTKWQQLFTGTPGPLDPDYYDYDLYKYDAPSKIADRIFARRYGNKIVLWNLTNLAWERETVTWSPGLSIDRVINQSFQFNVNFEYIPGHGGLDANYLFYTSRLDNTSLETTELVQGHLFKDHFAVQSNSAIAVYPMVQYPALETDPAFDRNIANYQSGEIEDLFEWYQGWAPHVTFAKAAQIVAAHLGQGYTTNAADQLASLVFEARQSVRPTFGQAAFALNQNVPAVSIFDFLAVLKEALGIVAYFDTANQGLGLIDLNSEIKGLPKHDWTAKEVKGSSRYQNLKDGVTLAYTAVEGEAVTPESILPAVSSDWEDLVSGGTFTNGVTYGADGKASSYGLGQYKTRSGEVNKTIPALPIICKPWARQRHIGTATQNVITGDILGATLSPDGRLFVWGDFTCGLYKNLVKLWPNGQLDTTFYPGLDFDGAISGVVISPIGQVYVGGSFTRAVGPTGETAEGKGLVRLNLIGLPDLGFNSMVGQMYGTTTYRRRVTAITANADILVVGVWGGTGSDYDIRGWEWDKLSETRAFRLERSNVTTLLHIHASGNHFYAAGAWGSTIKVNLSGEVDTDFNTDYPSLGQIQAITSTEGRTFFGGTNANLPNGILSTGPDDRALLTSEWVDTFRPNTAYSKSIRAMAIVGNTLFCVGNFEERLGPNTTSRGIAAYLLDGRPDTSFYLGSQGILANPIGGTVAPGDVRFLLNLNGKELLVGGTFNRVNEVTSQNLAILNRNAPHATGKMVAARLNTDQLPLPVVSLEPSEVIRFGLLTEVSRASGTIKTICSNQPNNLGLSLNFGGVNGLAARRLDAIIKVLTNQDRLEVDLNLTAIELGRFKMWHTVQLRGSRYVVYSLSYNLPLRRPVKATLVKVG